MLKLAVDAQLPLIAAFTRDILNMTEVVAQITGKQVTPYMLKQTSLEEDKLYVIQPGKVELPYVQLYEKMVGIGSSLLVINPPKVEEPMFDAGEIPVPKKLMLKFMTNVVDDEETASDLMTGLGGCTLKEAAELARLTMARDNSLTVRGLMVTRKSSFQASNGLAQVDTAQDYYAPPENLAEWVLREKDFFLTCNDARLVPRGLLFDGPPGTGKTAGAKWVAEQLGVPLYRFDIGGTRNKYVGQSEANMLANLHRLDHEEPCVALLDEIEKIFGGGEHGDSGTTTTMLSQLLWWLAEHKTRVLTIMTTNAAKKLPKELYREGRVDQMLWFGGLQKVEAVDFCISILATFKVKGDPKVLAKIVDKVFASSKIDDGGASTAPAVSQAALTKAMFNYVKSEAVKI